MSEHLLAPSVPITTDTQGATLDVGIAIPGPGRRLTVCWHGATLHVDLDEAAVAALTRVLNAPHPLIDPVWFEEDR